MKRRPAHSSHGATRREAWARPHEWQTRRFDVRPRQFRIGEEARFALRTIDQLIVLDPHLIAFVRKSLGSIWALEVLLLIRRTAPKPIRRDEIVRELRATPFLVRRVIDQLVAENLVAVEGDGDVKFLPSTPEQEQLCELLETASRERPIALRDAIVGSPGTKLRNLADAFRFTDKDKDKDK